MAVIVSVAYEYCLLSIKFMKAENGLQQVDSVKKYTCIVPPRDICGKMTQHTQKHSNK